MKLHSRVVLNDECPWEQRRGCKGIVVEAPEPGVYPDTHADDEVIVLLDDDPLRSTSDGWTCVLPAVEVDRIDWRYPEARRFVHDRAGGRCEAKLLGCTVAMECVHHVEGRRVRDAHHPDRLVGLCTVCHLFVHAHPSWSRERGFMRSRLGEVRPSRFAREEAT